MLAAYFRHVEDEFGNSDKLAEILFFIELLRKNPGKTWQVLKDAVNALCTGQTGQTGGVVEPEEPVEMPGLSYDTRNSKINTASSRAVRLIWVTHLATSESQISGPWRSVRVAWRVDTQSLEDVMTETFPKAAPLTANSEGRPINRSKLCAQYLRDHANIDLEWTTHLPDHLPR